MEFTEVVRRRRMVRSFEGRPLPADLVTGLLDDSLRAPSAGNTAASSWVVLEGSSTRRYWEHTTTADWRERSARWPGLSRAPVVALALSSEDAYRRRYAERDKSSSGLGAPDQPWPVPYWVGDTAFCVLTLLLAAEDAGLGACFLGNFRGETPLLEDVGVPPGWRLFGAVLLGHPDGQDHRSPSLARGPDRAARIHRGCWSS